MFFTLDCFLSAHQLRIIEFFQFFQQVELHHDPIREAWRQPAEE